MERAEILAKRLKALRVGLGLDEPVLALAPDDPLCTAMRLPERLSATERKEALRESLTEGIGTLEDEQEREALSVAYRLHPGHQERKLELRRASLAERYGRNVKTVERYENAGIDRLAQKLARPITTEIFPPFVWRKTENVYVIRGTPIPKWYVHVAVPLLLVILLVCAFFLGAMVREIDFAH
ncbi:hypothetical protein Lesp02_28380 [Lentzea sp. NBRC 105346]|uniref:hypothetical protein n=1 Tax=Lentzea sp. NBRC 105346 TaxID=3032205 RepID=UPI002555FCDB|nr:hypothetical protein [Lentzea sp. NBRC 105346]GLZ30649.1 hypothetical protein Lesp02_28380 [Lentzea sp. NBRC 105346]